MGVGLVHHTAAQLPALLHLRAGQQQIHWSVGLDLAGVAYVLASISIIA
jgi:hypothetical protein